MADEFTVQVLIGGKLVKTVPSSLSTEDLAMLRMRGASPAGPQIRQGVTPGTSDYAAVVAEIWPRWLNHDYAEVERPRE